MTACLNLLRHWCVWCVDVGVQLELSEGGSSLAPTVKYQEAFHRWQICCPGTAGLSCLTCMLGGGGILNASASCWAMKSCPFAPSPQECSWVEGPPVPGIESSVEYSLQWGPPCVDPENRGSVLGVLLSVEGCGELDIGGWMSCSPPRPRSLLCWRPEDGVSCVRALRLLLGLPGGLLELSR